MIDAVRTPDEYFEHLPDYPFAAHYTDTISGVEGLRVHYIDEPGIDSDEVFLCLHGQPTWSYLYRKMIPIFSEPGGRVVAPDLLGFGKSDKPTSESIYTFDFHREMLLGLITALDLRNITLVCQDWGGILGLTLPPAMPDRFSRLIVMNTGLPIGKPVSDGFSAWKALSAANPDMDIAGLMRRAVAGISDAEAAAYAAPFPNMTYKAGVRRFPNMVMVAPGMPGIEHTQRAPKFWSGEWAGKSFMAVGMQDPVLGPNVMTELRDLIRGCPEPLEVAEAGHFVQEHGEQIARAALASFESD